jgi:transposase
MTVRALRCTARRVHALQAETDELLAELERLVAAIAPWLLELFGVGPISAAQLLVSWSHAGRFRSEAAFAALAGPARSPPPPARSSVTASTVAATVSSTRHYTPSRWSACVTTPRPAPTPPAGPPRARALEMLSAV